MIVRSLLALLRSFPPFAVLQFLSLAQFFIENDGNLWNTTSIAYNANKQMRKVMRLPEVVINISLMKILMFEFSTTSGNAWKHPNCVFMRNSERESKGEVEIVFRSESNEMSAVKYQVEWIQIFLAEHALKINFVTLCSVVYLFVEAHDIASVKHWMVGVRVCECFTCYIKSSSQFSCPLSNPICLSDQTSFLTLSDIFAIVKAICI